MTHIICSDIVASITELKSNPMATIKSAHGKPLAILNRNQPVFYCISPDLYEAMLDLIDDIELCKIIEARTFEKEIPVEIDDL